MVYDFQLFNLHIRMEPPFPLTESEDTKQFMFPVTEDEEIFWDLELNFECCEELPNKIEGGAQCHDRVILHEDNEWWVSFLPCEGKKPYAVTYWNEIEGAIICYYRKDSEPYMNFSKNYVLFLSIEMLVYRMGGFILHSSFIRKKDGGTILFSAAPGTGKSTQAALWEKYRGAEIINGDRAAVIPNEEGLCTYGLPFAGTSGIYRNESGMLQAIVVLRQAPYNKVTRITGSMVARHLYSEVMIHRWDARFSADMLERICTLAVPVYLLECKPDEGAIEVLEAVLAE